VRSVQMHTPPAGCAQRHTVVPLGLHALQV